MENLNSEKFLTVADTDTVCIKSEDYKKLIEKATKMDIIASHVMGLRGKAKNSNYISVDTDLIFYLVTGMDKDGMVAIWNDCEAKKEGEEA